MFCYFTYNPKYSNKNLKIKMKKSSIFCLGGQDPFWSEDWTVLHIDPACQKIFLLRETPDSNPGPLAV